MDSVEARRLWLPWRPRCRLVLLYPRCWHQACVWLERFDEITIIAFAISIYLVWGEWVLLWLLFPFVLLARLVGARPWPLITRAGDRRRWIWM